jgi:hypothetical protein
VLVTAKSVGESRATRRLAEVRHDF